MPGGWLAQKYGGRVTLIVAFALWSTGSLLTPRSARSTRGITAARVLVGIAQGGIIPSIHTVLSQVSPLFQASTYTPSVLHFISDRKSRCIISVEWGRAVCAGLQHFWS